MLGRVFHLALPYNGSVVKFKQGQETASLPNGKEVEFNGPSHENGGVETLLPINSKVKSDFLKPSSLLKKKEDLEELSEMLGVKVLH